MGTWAVDAFGNDFAQDWAADLHEVSNMDAVAETLDVVLQGGGELEAPLAAEGLVAVEVLARLQGKGGEQTEDSAMVDEWVEARKAKHKPRADLSEKAQKAIERILSEQSELRQLWQESEHYEAWRASVLALQARLA